MLVKCIQNKSRGHKKTSYANEGLRYELIVVNKQFCNSSNKIIAITKCKETEKQQK